ncbi:MAG: phosphopyruvate hydratase [Patescibacteria group bacterium]
MANIKKISAREILDSRGNPTLEVKVVLENGIWAKDSVPSGVSAGGHEALELRDNDKSRFLGRGVLKAVRNVNEIIGPALVGQKITQQKEIDQKMIALDGTENKSKLGANAILGVSLACARAGSYDQRLPLYQYLRQIYNLPLVTYQLPTPMFNVINGGKHSDSGLDIQEFMLVPQTTGSFKEKLRIGVEIFNALREILERKKMTFAVGDEGGFAPKLKTTKNTLETLSSIAHYTQYRLGSQIFFGLDAAASVFYRKEKNKYHFEGKDRSAEEMIKIYLDWIKKYPIALFEDPLAEDDWENWSKFTEQVLAVKPNFAVIGDDIFTTNLKRFEKGLEMKVANAILIKPNQVGTLTETMNCIDLAIKKNYQIVISHRSGETNDDFIADLAVAVNAQYIKTGAPNRGERVAKYNRLLEIEEEIKKND